MALGFPVSADLLAQQIKLVFAAWGVAPEPAETATQVMVATDLAGIDSHGIGMLPTYLLYLRQGIVNPQAQPKILRDDGATVLIDADRGLGHPPAVDAMTRAMEKAERFGIGLASVTNSNHYGAAGYYAEMASAQGMLGFSFSTAPIPAVVPTFGRDAFFGTNPLAFGAPGGIEPPFVLDMATSAVALGKLAIARRLGKDLPAGWAFDDAGQPLTDAALALQMRRLAPLGGTRALGGHKGYGLAAMVEILSACLGGARSEERQTGHCFIAIAPHFLRPEGAFEADLDHLVGRLREVRPVDPDQPVQVAGDPERTSRAMRSADGIPLSAALVEEIRKVCAESSADFVLEPHQ